MNLYLNLAAQPYNNVQLQIRVSAWFLFAHVIIEEAFIYALPFNLIQGKQGT